MLHRYGPGIRLPRRGFLQTLGAAFTSLRPGPTLAASQTSIWDGNFDTDRIYGYADQQSVEQWQSVQIMLSCKPNAPNLSGRIRFHRLGHYIWGRQEVWTSDHIEVAAQPVLRAAATIGASWRPALEVSTAGWPPGVYTADFEDDGRSEPYYNLIQLVVRPHRPRGGVLVKLSTNTWQAYNTWGGHSLYPDDDDPGAQDRGAMVSFDRPTPPALFEYEIYLIVWLEALASRQGFTVDYASNFDVYQNTSLLDSYPLVICGSHDEYWSREEFDAFERRIFDKGANTVFLGANTGYWQIRYADIDKPPDGEFRGRQIVCHKSASDPIIARAGHPDADLLATTKFRENGRRPETMLMGAAYQSWFQSDRDANPRYPYRVETTNFPFFAGTGLEVGDVLADVVGYEWDCRDPAGDGGRLWTPASRIRELPMDAVHVLFSGRPVSHNGRQGIAEAVYFKSHAGAQVFNAGSVRWAWGLGRTGFEREAFKKFNENLITALLQR